MQKKADDYLKWFEEADKKKFDMLKAGKITRQEYQTWRRDKILSGQRWYAMSQTMADNLANSNGIAASIINGYIPEVYAINGNFAAYEIERNTNINTAFTLYNEQAVERIIAENPDLLPPRKIDVAKDTAWNKKNLNSAVIQSIIQGDSVLELANRLAAVSDMNQTSAIRNARTMTTAAQNGGRQSSFRRAQSMGIKLKNQWITTLDGHARDSHRAIDGEVVEVGKEFSNGLTYPGDPSGPPEEVYNCRCNLVAVFDDQDYSKIERDNRLGSMSYENWKNAHGGEPLFRAARNANRDLKMHEEYQELLGNKVPNNFKKFQEIKYYQPEQWTKMVSDARKARNQRRRSHE